MSSKINKLSIPFLDRLTTKISIAAVVCLFAFAAAITFLVETGFRRNQFRAYSSSQTVIETQTQTAMITSVTELTRLFDSHLREIAQPVRVLAVILGSVTTGGDLSINDRPEIENIFTHLLNQNQDLSGLYFTDLDKIQISVVRDGTGSPGVIEQFPFQSLDRNLPLTWSILEPFVVIHAPVYINDRFQGFISASITLSHLVKHLQEGQTLPGSSVFMTDNVGKIFLSSMDGLSIQNVEGLVAPSSFQSGSTTIKIKDVTYLLINSQLEEPGWKLVSISPVEAISDQSKKIANAVWAEAEDTIRATIYLVFIISLIMLLLTLFILERLFNTRISRLLQAVQSIISGDYQVTVPDSSYDELGVLGKSFNQMSSEILRRRTELIQVNEDLRQSEEMYRNLAHTLEARVDESTSEIKQLYDQAATRSQELEVLYQADEQLYSHLRVDEVLQAMVDVAVDQLEVDKSSVQVWDDARQRLGVRAMRGFNPESIARMNNYRPVDGIAAKVFQSGEIITLEDATSAPFPAGEIARVEGIASLLSIPITIKNQIFGVFGVNFKMPRQFTSRDLRIYQALAQRAAIAIENASLYEKAESAATLEERQRLARELHDAITQSLYSLVLLSEAARRHAVTRNIEQVEHHLGRLGETAQQALKELRLLVYELRPLALTQVGLSGAIRQRLDAVEKRAGVQSRLLVQGEVLLSPSQEEQVYRIVQEALNNALKHSQARAITVHLAQNDNNFEVEVRDNGRGFDPNTSENGGIGLSSMRERAERIGGKLFIESDSFYLAIFRARIVPRWAPLVVILSQVIVLAMLPYYIPVMIACIGLSGIGYSMVTGKATRDSALIPQPAA